jgi:hypothetical protein
MAVNDWLSGKNRSRSRKRARRRGPVLLGGVRDWHLEERCLLSSDISFPTDTPGVVSLSQVMYDGVTGTDVKTITITNNSPTQTIYPFLRGQNSNQGEAMSTVTGLNYTGTGEYDPYDPTTQDYRGYIGYSDGKNDIAGLQPGHSITITVPMVFWDSGRIFFSTDGADQFATHNAASPTGSPFYFFDKNTQSQYYLQTQGGDLTKLYFTAAFTDFDSNGLPTTMNWKSPVATGKLQPGKYSLAGPGVPASAFVTVDSANPDYVTLGPGQQLTGSQTSQLYILNASPYPDTHVSPTDHLIQKGFTLADNTQQGSPTTTNGEVMWYHAQGTLNPNDDAPFQLTEVAFRSELYNTKGFQALMSPAAFVDAKENAINYDISMVDSINMPVAMEAANATITHTGSTAPYGWVGSAKSLSDFQAALADFTKTNTGGNNVNGLGSYFGGRGYPSYLQVSPGDVKLPSGFNLFDVSPSRPNGLADVNFSKSFTDGSSISGPRQYMLTSAGVGPITFPIQGATGSSGNNLMLSTSTLADQYALNSLIGVNFNNGFPYDVTYNGNTKLGTVTGLIYDKDKKNVIGVQVDGTVPDNADSLVFNFNLPGTDYATSAIEKIWYSWAQHYVNNVSQLHPAPPPGVVTGTVSGGNLLTLSDSSLLKGLVPGMVVTSPDDPSAKWFILAIDQKGQIHLSETVPGGVTHFNIANPDLNSIAGYKPGMSLYTFNFQTPKEQADALAFAQTVYTVMGAFSHTTAGATDPASTMLAHVIGGLFGGFYPNGNPDTTSILTNMSKSALRGVPDFTSPLYSNPSQWYPDPALPTGGLSFNPYNLDPYVWFIHSKLVGATAYAFALDDDTSDVEAKGATVLDLSVGGLGGTGYGVPNKDPYSPVAPFGVVTSASTTAAEKFSTLGGLTNPQIVGQTRQFDDNDHLAGTLVNGPGVQLGTTVQIQSITTPDIKQSTLTLSNPLGQSSTYTTSYTFFGAFTFTGTVQGANQPADTIWLDSQDAYNTLLKLAPFANVRVTGEGIDPAKTVTVSNVFKDSGTGKYVVQLPAGSLNPDLVSQKGGSYAYTFGSPVISPVSDPGFEFPNAQNVTGEYLHGTQVATTNWIFTDGSPGTPNRYAGIAFDKGGADSNSEFTNGNGAAPQGVQVGFVGGNGSIATSPKSLVTLVSGTYDLSFFVARSAVAKYWNDSDPQKLNVLLVPGSDLKGDGINLTPNAPITPSGTDFGNTPFHIQFTVGTGASAIRPGKYAIKFQGTATGSSTALIDNIVLTQSHSLGSPPPLVSPPPSGNSPGASSGMNAFQERHQERMQAITAFRDATTAEWAAFMDGSLQAPQAMAAILKDLEALLLALLFPATPL